MEDLKTRQRLFSSFPELRYSHLEFNHRKIDQYFTNCTRCNKRYKVSSSANSLFSDVFAAVAVLACLNLPNITKQKTPDEINGQHFRGSTSLPPWVAMHLGQLGQKSRSKGPYPLVSRNYGEPVGGPIWDGWRTVLVGPGVRSGCFLGPVSKG